MTNDDDQRPPTDDGDREGAGDGSITRRTAIIAGAAAIGGAVIWAPESLAVPSRKMSRAQKDIEAAVKIVRSSRVSSSLRAKTLPDLLEVQKAIDRQAHAEAAARGSKARAMRARSAQVSIPAVLCPTLQAIRNAFVGSPAAAAILPILDRLLLTFGCPGPTGGTGSTGA